jgi:phospholipid/cholesterol/gamma-HCH transport system ATP-binding protein
MANNPSATVANTIRLEEIRYRASAGEILAGVDLAINSGEIMAIMGRSGEGKTTLLRLMMGLIRPNAGRIWIGEQDITQLSEEELLHIRMKMGLVFQNAALFDSLTVAENVAFGLVEHNLAQGEELQKTVRRNLALVGMQGSENLLPAQLSGGMRKRVGVARALVMKPDIIFYDEPTAGLDPPTASSLNDLIVRLRDRFGVTSVIVSHDVPALAPIIDRAAVLAHGQIVATGTLEELRNNNLPELNHFFLFWKGESSK